MIPSLSLILMMPLVVWGQCDPPYVPVGVRCLYYETSNGFIYEAAQEYCNGIQSGKLATISSAQQFKDMIDYIYEEGLAVTSYWVDGTDTQTEGEWLSSSGDNIPMGTPFWGGYPNYQEPNGGQKENCLEIHMSSYYYLNDNDCSIRLRPICEKEWTYRTAYQNQSSGASECPLHYVNIGGECLSFMTSVSATWDEARIFCEESYGQLAMVNDIEVLRAIYLYLQEEELSQYDFWLGGSDEAEEGVWIWLDGSPVPTGTPFWGLINNVQEPDGGSAENHLTLLGHAYSFFRDSRGGTHPLCQWIHQ